jgi:hypothetical protein
MWAGGEAGVVVVVVADEQSSANGKMDRIGPRTRRT